MIYDSYYISLTKMKADCTYCMAVKTADQSYIYNQNGMTMVDLRTMNINVKAKVILRFIWRLK